MGVVVTDEQGIWAGLVGAWSSECLWIVYDGEATGSRQSLQQPTQ